MQLSNNKFIYGFFGGTLYKLALCAKQQHSKCRTLFTYFFDFTRQDYNVKIANLKLKQTKTSFLLEYSRKIKIILHLANFVSLNKLDKVW